jgi:tRNA(Ile)-lysidine synthetase-like protein
MPSTNPSPLETLRLKLNPLPPFPWGVAYSGGRDSAVLLWALSRLAPPEQIVALHVDHGWRSGEERRAEAETVEAMCQRLGVGLRRFAAPSEPVRTEAAARDHRYSCFQNFVAENLGSPVFLAHHADDQAETVLMRLLRGRSWRGLTGMTERRGPYWRPFLNLRASDLAKTAESEGLAWHEDSSNASPQWTRNHLRLKVFPLLDERFPRTVEALCQLAGAWALRAPKTELDSRWSLEGQQASVDAAAWLSWDALERQIQLEAASAALGFERPPSRRFLEAAARSRRITGAGWSWSLTPMRAVWRRVVQVETMEYFVVAERGREYRLPGHLFLWSTEPGPGTQSVPADPERPVVWRSAASGLALESEDGVWDKVTRRRRMGSFGSDRALLLQDGLVRAVADIETRRLVWVEVSRKLNKTGIFVTLESRSEYERR